MKILVIGATGFIGKHLVKKLSYKENEIFCLVREESKKENVDYLKELGTRLIYGDLEKPESLVGICDGIDVVIYLAGGGNIHYLSEKDFSKIFYYNINTLENLLKVAESIKKIIFFSSISAMGAQVNFMLDENSYCKPVIPHEKCKYEAEKIIKRYAELNGYEYSILRPSIVYGEYGFGDSYGMIKMIDKGYFFMPGNGNNITPWVYVEDVVNAALLLIEKGKNEVYIINHEERLSFNNIIKFVGNRMKKRVFVIHVPLFFIKPFVYLQEKIFLLFGKSPIINMYRLRSMTSDRRYLIDKLKGIGYRERVSFEEGMKRTIRWYMKNGYL